MFVRKHGDLCELRPTERAFDERRGAEFLSIEFPQTSSNVQGAGDAVCLVLAGHCLGDRFLLATDHALVTASFLAEPLVASFVELARELDRQWWRRGWLSLLLWIDGQ